MADTGRTPRRRGRPRKTQSGDTRALIAEAAAAEFSDNGYDATSMRGIARRAGVDSALVHHYFDTKAALFAEVVKLPVRPDRVIEQALSAPIEGLGASIVRTVVLTWEDPKVRPVGITVLRSAINGGAAGSLIRQFMLRELGTAIAKRLSETGIDAAEAQLRASLVLSQMAGALMLRYVIGAEPLASASVDELIERLAPAVQGHIDGRIAR